MNEVESEIIRQPESEKYGRNVAIHAIFVRHGEKGVSTTTGETALSERGRQGTKRFGRRLEKRKTIKAHSSDTERTMETARLITESSPTQKKMTQRVKHELGFYYDKKGEFLQAAMKIKKETFGDNFEELPEEEKKRRIRESDQHQIDYYLNFGDKRPDPGTYSPVETAAMIARRVDIYIRMPEKLYSGSDIDLINISHDFPLSVFLKEVLVRNIEGEKVRGFNSINEIGGPIEFNEGFEILIRTDDKGQKSTKMIFRGQEYEVDGQRLEELIEIAKNLEKQRK